MKKKWLTVDHYILDQILHRIKEITVIEKSDETKVLIDGDDKMWHDIITLKNIAILITCVFKYDGRFFRNHF